MSTPCIPETRNQRESGWPDDPDEALALLRLGTRDYKRVLGAILRKHNHRHRLKDKGVSLKTMFDRDRFLFSFFHELRHETKYANLDPRALANRHIQVMVRRWVERGLATATIHNYLSFLRSYAIWIGKLTMVRKPDYYLGASSPQGHRCQVAIEDHSWTAKNIDIEAKIAEIASFDRWVSLQLELCYRFGFRGKEARHFRPHGAIVSRAEAIARDADAFPECRAFVRAMRGTKGGRMRDLPLTTDEQRDLLKRVQAAVGPDQFVGNPSMTRLQSEARFYYVIRKFGISRKVLGVVAHGLRHQHVNDRFEVDAGTPSPVRGGESTGQSNQARQRGARVLGHNREQVTSCYLGSSAVMRTRGLKPTEPPMT
jgi:site-specific recombinase XerC